MRRLKRDRGKQIPVEDLQKIAEFRAELEVYGQLREQGLSHQEAMAKVFASDLSDNEKP